MWLWLSVISNTPGSWFMWASLLRLSQQQINVLNCSVSASVYLVTEFPSIANTDNLFWTLYIIRSPCPMHFDISSPQASAQWGEIFHVGKQILSEKLCLQLFGNRTKKLLSQNRHYLAIFCISFLWQRGDPSRKKKSLLSQHKAT